MRNALWRLLSRRESETTPVQATRPFAVQQVLAMHASDPVKACWCGLTDTPKMTSHLFYKSFRAASKRRKQYTQRNSLFRAVSAHGSCGDLLACMLAGGWPLPVPDEDSALRFLQDVGSWKAGATVDGLLLDRGLNNGIDCSACSKADGEPLLKAVLDAQVLVLRAWRLDFSFWVLLGAAWFWPPSHIALRSARRSVCFGSRTRRCSDSLQFHDLHCWQPPPDLLCVVYRSATRA
jgi:hypothetical protein